MDLSKLPRMSDTRRGEAQRLEEQQTSPSAPPPPRPDVDPEGRQQLDYQGARVYAADPGAGAWISLVVGGLLILIWPRFWQWLFHVSFGTSFTWTFSDAAGNPLTYPQTVFFWGDLALALFAVALITEGAVLLLAAASRAAVWFSLVTVGVATLLNFGFLAYAMSLGLGIQIPSTLAVLFGGFMIVQHWQLLHGPRRRYLVVEEGPQR